MKIQLDTTNKTIKLESSENLGDFFKAIKQLLPNDLWKEFTLETNTTITWSNPIIWKYYDYIPQPYIYPHPITTPYIYPHPITTPNIYPHPITTPWITYSTGSYNVVNSSHYDDGNRINTCCDNQIMGLSSGVYNIEVGFKNMC